MTHLVWCGIISYCVNTAVKVSAVVETSNLSTIVVDLEGSTRVGSSTDGRHNKDSWEGDRSG